MLEFFCNFNILSNSEFFVFFFLPFKSSLKLKIYKMELFDQCYYGPLKSIIILDELEKRLQTPN